jgi:hypothetical protein
MVTMGTVLFSREQKIGLKTRVSIRQKRMQLLVVWWDIASVLAKSAGSLALPINNP